MPVPTPPELAPVADRVLVLDDSVAQRGMLCALLKRWGLSAIASGDPHEALHLARDPSIGLIISDWMMPGMTGPEFCRQLRVLERDGYAYVILLTSRDETDALSEGLAAGADDFLTKPLSPPELRARLKAGQRIVAMQHELVKKNHQLGDALAQLRHLYEAIDTDLDEARRLQHSLLRETDLDLPGVRLSMWLQSSGHVGGDVVGHFRPNARLHGFYSIDVSGHGVASAMIGARVAGMLSDAAPEQNIALSPLGASLFRALPPQFVTTRLNRLLMREMSGDRYLTLCLTTLDIRTGVLTFVQAGHPHPILLRADGRTEKLGDGGLPVGLLLDAAYASRRVRLVPGDRLVLYSDGMTECVNGDGAMLDEDGLIEICTRYRNAPWPAFLPGIRGDLMDFVGGADFPDDASALAIEYTGPPEP